MPLNAFYLLLLLVGVTALAVGLFSRTIKAVAAPPLLALGLGVLAGPLFLDALQLGLPEQARKSVLEELCRIAVGLGVMGIALRLGPNVLRSLWRSAAVLVSAVMLLMWLVTSAVVFVMLGVDVTMAFLIGAILTPTDPVVASSIVTGKTAVEHVPLRIRALISLESGANDGLAYLLVSLPLLLLAKPYGEAIGDWVLRTLVWEVLVAVLIGALCGYTAAWLVKKAEAENTIERPTFLTASIALTLVTLGLLKLLGMDGILGVFAAGLVLSLHTRARERTEEHDFQEGASQIAIFAALILFGAMLPWQGWRELGLRGIGLAAAVLLARRLPPVALLRPLLPALNSTRDTLFVGWFGPLGLSAVLYALIAQRGYANDELWAAASLVIAASIVAHGLSAAPFSLWYAKHRD